MLYVGHFKPDDAAFHERLTTESRNSLITGFAALEGFSIRVMNQNYTLQTNPASQSFHYTENIIPLAGGFNSGITDLILPQWGN